MGLSHLVERPESIRENGVKSAIKYLVYLNDKDMNFVSHPFDIPLTSMNARKETVSESSLELLKTLP